MLVFINKCDAAGEERRSGCSAEELMGFSEDNARIVKGSALCALEDTKPELGVEAINQLMEVVDHLIPTQRENWIFTS